MSGIGLDAHAAGAEAGPIADAAAIAGLWGAVRLVVIDTETVTAGSDLRVVSVAVVTCRGGFVRGKWQTLINAGVPVDPDSARVHGLTDEHLAGEPSFDDVADVIRGALTPGDGEQLVFVAHNVNFDAGVLREEFARLGEDIPELPILDTAGRLAAAVGVRPAGASLAALCEALGIVHDRSHDALADAVVCAEAVVALLNRAATQGETDFATLLASVSGDATTRSLTAVDARSLRSRIRWAPLPADHITGHSTLLGRRAGKRMLGAWRIEVAECAALRCRHLDDRVANAAPPSGVLLVELEAALDERVADGDAAGVATVLGALLPLLPALPPASGRLGFRTVQLDWALRWGPRLEALGRCGAADRCPACRRRAPCPLDTWPDTVAAAALGDPTRYAAGFFETKGREAGAGAHMQWRKKGATQVADAAVWLCLAHWRAVGHPDRAGQVAQLAWGDGCRQPEVVDAYAGQLAAAGGVADLRAALLAAKLTLRARNGSTHDGWARLQARTHQLAGQLQRLKVRPSGLFDGDGEVIPVRRHHPEQPHRSRPARFKRRT